MAERVAAIWGRFGPYHLSRLEAAGRLFAREGLLLYGLEVAQEDSEYPWQGSAAARAFTREVLFPGRDYAQLTRAQVARAVDARLDELSPGAVAINGWSFAEARAALRWCARNGRCAVLMSDSRRAGPRRLWHKEWVKGRLLRSFDAALVAGTQHRRYCQDLGLEQGRIFVGYDVVDNACFESRADALRREPASARQAVGLPERYLLTCCRFIEEKNLFRLLDAFAACRSRAGPSWHLVLCGDGPLRARLQAHARGDPTVHFPGFVQLDRLPDYYALASGFILPSARDTWGLVVNEAMAAGMPVLVSRMAGCCPDLVREGENGFAFDPFGVDDMMGAIGKLCVLTDGERARMGECGRRIIARWGLDRFARSLLQAVRAGMDHARDVRGASSLLDRVLLRVCA